MDEEKNLPQVPKRKNTNSSLNASHSLRAVGVAYVLYLLYQIVRGYVEGGPEAPSLWLLILAIVTLGGGALVIVLLTVRELRKNREENGEDTKSP